MAISRRPIIKAKRRRGMKACRIAKIRRREKIIRVIRIIVKSCGLER
jgi:hypothetical protein